MAKKNNRNTVSVRDNTNTPSITRNIELNPVGDVLSYNAGVLPEIEINADLNSEEYRSAMQKAAARRGREYVYKGQEESFPLLAGIAGLGVASSLAGAGVLGTVSVRAMDVADIISDPLNPLNYMGVIDDGKRILKSLSPYEGEFRKGTKGVEYHYNLSEAEKKALSEKQLALDPEHTLKWGKLYYNKFLAPRLKKMIERKMDDVKNDYISSIKREDRNVARTFFSRIDKGEKAEDIYKDSGIAEKLSSVDKATLDYFDRYSKEVDGMQNNYNIIFNKYDQGFDKFKYLPIGEYDSDISGFYDPVTDLMAVVSNNKNPIHPVYVHELRHRIESEMGLALTDSFSEIIERAYGIPKSAAKTPDSVLADEMISTNSEMFTNLILDWSKSKGYDTVPWKDIDPDEIFDYIENLDGDKILTFLDGTNSYGKDYANYIRSQIDGKKITKEEAVERIKDALIIVPAAVGAAYVGSTENSSDVGGSRDYTMRDGGSVDKAQGGKSKRWWEDEAKRKQVLARQNSASEASKNATEVYVPDFEKESFIRPDTSMVNYEKIRHVQDVLFNNTFNKKALASGYKDAQDTQVESVKDKYYPIKLGADAVATAAELYGAGYTLMSGAKRIGLLNNSVSNLIPDSDRAQMMGSLLGIGADTYQLMTADDNYDVISNILGMTGGAAGFIGGTNLLRNSSIYGKYGDKIDKALDFVGYTTAGSDLMSYPIRSVYDHMHEDVDGQVERKQDGGNINGEYDLMDNIKKLGEAVLNPKDAAYKIMRASNGSNTLTLDQIFSAIINGGGEYSGGKNGIGSASFDYPEMYIYGSSEGAKELSEEDKGYGVDYSSYLKKNGKKTEDVRQYEGNFGYDVILPESIKPILDDIVGTDKNLTIGYSGTGDDTDQVGHHLGRINRNKDGDYFMSYSDLWDFSPKDYTEKWGGKGLSGISTYIQSYLLDKVGTPFIVRSKRGIKFVPDEEFGTTLSTLFHSNDDIEYGMGAYSNETYRSILNQLNNKKIEEDVDASKIQLTVKDAFKILSTPFRKILGMRYGGDVGRTLSEEKEKVFLEWYKSLAKHKGLNQDPDDVGHYYDYRGFWEDNPEIAEAMLSDNSEAHFTDKYKLPGHPTFSKESIYGGNEFGGEWVVGPDGKNYYSPSVYTGSYLNRIIDYLKGANEGVLLNNEYVLPTDVPRKAKGDDGVRKNQDYIYYRLINEYGFAPIQAIAVVANLTHESGLTDDILGDNGASYGLQQWQGQRRKNLFSFAKGKGHSKPTFEDQVDFLAHEYKNNQAFQFKNKGQNLYQEGKVNNDIFDYFQYSKADFDNAESLWDATIAWNQGVGRPNKKYAFNGRRYEIAVHLANRYGVEYGKERKYTDMGYSDMVQQEPVNTGDKKQDYYENYGKQILVNVLPAQTPSTVQSVSSSETNVEKKLDEDEEYNAEQIEAMRQEQEMEKRRALVAAFLPNIQLKIKGTSKTAN